MNMLHLIDMKMHTMMKTLGILAVAMLFGTTAMAQDSIRIVKDLSPNYTKVLRDTVDINGVHCAKIIIENNDSSIEVNAFNGNVRTEKKKGEIIIWVSTDYKGRNGTKNLTITASNVPPKTYELPFRLKEKGVYVMRVNVERAYYYPFYINAGFNVVSIMGPSLSVGYHFGNINVEAGVVLGLNSSDDHYFYKPGEALYAAHSYKAIRAYLRGGYDLKFSGSGFFIVEPQVGVAFNAIQGGDDSRGFKGQKDAYMKNLGSLSALAALRLKFAINKHLKFHVTPEFDFGVSKNENVKDLSDKDSKVKSWTDGINLNVGLMIYL